MPYTLHRLAPGSYDLLLGAAIVGSVVREEAESGFVRGWYAELLSAAPPLPSPFTQEAHRFDTLLAVVNWLGEAIIEDGS
ncbi:hypothetical protein GOFOIKOB_5714 [Methylobacterium tardum]|uniref:Uncharacterized protein n=1 Tax=Methylobacterium tardum TaxID=374432 RepID=A0AA37TQ23_9HYPH|nr:hypothetical protein [Methylobacterium tardum]URD35201.1 hypothetical protein M6G65_22065 [Methylobacterium tardum]GJE52641.1 hypothetical protein GOFOIKOB_5714 [Methylobacterium tardum]GLS73516.1 hypothetical protein GCM10007890_55310 [Methylobacterium tardum]